MIKLNERLKKAVSLALGAHRIIDVGCDHGYLACYMLQNKNAEFAYLSDINAGPLEKARKTVENAGLCDKCELRLCAGLDGFSAEDADTVFICGMGGEMIASILENAPWTKDAAHTLILQPMTRDNSLRRFLGEHGYYIEKEALVYDEGRLYCVMKAKGGAGDCGEKYYYLFSKAMKTDPLFADFVAKMRKRYEKIVKSKGENADTAEEERILRILEENYAD